MIHVALSVPPHHGKTEYLPESMTSPGPWVRDPSTPPPAIIWEHAFRTWEAVRHTLVEVLELKTDSSSLNTFLDQLVAEGPTPPGEQNCSRYVGVEFDLLDCTGQIYIDAGLSIEGEELTNEDEQHGPCHHNHYGNEVLFRGAPG